MDLRYCTFGYLHVHVWNFLLRKSTLFFVVYSFIPSFSQHLVGTYVPKSGDTKKNKLRFPPSRISQAFQVCSSVISARKRSVQSSGLLILICILFSLCFSHFSHTSKYYRSFRVEVRSEHFGLTRGELPQTSPVATGHIILIASF